MCNGTALEAHRAPPHAHAPPRTRKSGFLTSAAELGVDVLDQTSSRTHGAAGGKCSHHARQQRRRWAMQMKTHEQLRLPTACMGVPARSGAAELAQVFFSCQAQARWCRPRPTKWAVGSRNHRIAAKRRLRASLEPHDGEHRARCGGAASPRDPDVPRACNPRAHRRRPSASACNRAEAPSSQPANAASGAELFTWLTDFARGTRDESRGAALQQPS